MEKLKTNTCTHTESHICKDTHTIPTDENILEVVIQLFYLFINLFIYLFINVLLF